MERAQGGHWLPQELQARQANVRHAMIQIERQQERLLEAYLAEVLELVEFERKQQELACRQESLVAQQRQLDAIAQQRVELSAVADSIEAFCAQVREGLANATFAQRRALVELLIDRVIVTDGEVEIRYVIPTSPDGPHYPFCHLRSDYLNVEPQAIFLKGLQTGRLIADHHPTRPASPRPRPRQREMDRPISLLGDGDIMPEPGLAACHRDRLKKLLTPVVQRHVETILYGIAERYGFEIDTLSIQADHVHLFVSFPPTCSIAQVVKIFKGVSAHQLSQVYPQIEEQLWGAPIWAPGYYVSTVSDRTTSQQIRRYIQKQEYAKDQPTLFEP
ncbi:MAG: IS200/IS605 family transposase [Candidatus Bipolaricaulia bacterium]